MMDRLRFEADGVEIVYPGGNGVIASAVLARHGIYVRFLGQVGDDAHGQLIRRLLVRSSVDVSQLRVVSALQTKVATMRVHADATANPWL